jgi:hypothetical protein
MYIYIYIYLHIKSILLIIYANSTLHIYFFYFLNFFIYRKFVYLLCLCNPFIYYLLEPFFIFFVFLNI